MKKLSLTLFALFACLFLTEASFFANFRAGYSRVLKSSEASKHSKSKHSSEFEVLENEFEEEKPMVREEEKSACKQFIDQCKKAFKDKPDQTFCEILTQREVECEGDMKKNKKCFEKCAGECAAKTNDKAEWLYCYGICGRCHPDLKNNDKKKDDDDDDDDDKKKDKKKDDKKKDEAKKDEKKKEEPKKEEPKKTEPKKDDKKKTGTKTRRHKLKSRQQRKRPSKSAPVA
eukprot:TRINITY_DN4104_c0_g1_i12.p1 TRINITY_DN4104_c0_g1~~TRINITY_DN4104_c0_g1_i12.p1  ORF type:complete len:230 (-),score=83.20 TRINITY_DN4104_c0_g1_i12:109-798(-)